MPLVASVDGERVVSFDCDERTWTTLRARSRAGEVLLRCGSPAYLRANRSGLRHFAHQPRTTCTDHLGESPRHLAAKRELIMIARAAGWAAAPEVPGPGYIADVQATAPDGRRVIFEVQLSEQSPEHYRERTKQRTSDGARVLWLAKVRPPRSSYAPANPLLTPDPDVPLVQLLDPDDGSWQVQVGHQEVRLAILVSAFLEGTAAPRRHVVGAGCAVVEVMAHSCWKCGRSSSVWRANETSVRGKCGTEGEEPMHSGLWEQDRPEALPFIREAVADHVARRSGPRIASLSPRYTQTTRTTYMAFGCPNCRAVFGDFYMGSAWSEAHYADAVDVIEIDLATELSVMQPHWCRDTGSGLCDPSDASPPQAA